MTDYVSKPVSPRMLADVLGRWLGKDQLIARNELTAPVVAETGPAVQVWDRTVMLNRLMGDDELLLEICAAFLADMPRQIEKLTERVAAGDLPASERLAHAIKGAAANVGEQPMQACAAMIETSAVQGNLGQIKEELETLRAMFGDLEQAMVENQKKGRSL